MERQHSKPTDVLGSPVTEFYDGKNIFLTGASGFVGKVLLEKLLRSCPGIGHVYILLRCKKSKSVGERLQTLFTSQAFDLLKVECPNALSKVIPVEGDISYPSLGLSDTDADELIRNVSVVFHSAATVRFNEPLSAAVRLNLLGTKNVFELSKKIPNLSAFVHVSTAYSNCDRQDIKEVVYPVDVTPQYVLDTYKYMDPDILDAMSKQLVGDRPNTYTLTKALAENYLESNAGDLPVVIVRPSIVTASWKEPQTGWVDSLSGITGVYFTISTGLLRVVRMDRQANADFIPVDVVTNLLVTVAWKTATTKRMSTSIPVYNCTSSSINLLRWETVEDVAVSFIKKNPSLKAFRHPTLRTTTNDLVHFVGVTFNHYLPAVFVDFWRLIRGKKPRMVQLYNRFHQVLWSQDFFSSRGWKFAANNVMALYEQMAPKDQMCFDFNIKLLEWPKYIENHIVGMRYFMMKEDDTKLDAARKRMKFLYVRSVVVKTSSLIAFLWFLLRRSTKIRNLAGYILLLIKNLFII